MQPSVTFRKVWSDTDVVEFEIASSDGKSIFRNRVYTGHGALKELIQDLGTFRDHIFGGLYNITFGHFGPEYAGGAFEARLQFQPPGTLFVSVMAESEWGPFKKFEVASSATLYMTSEPGLLDNFIEALRNLDNGQVDEASLICK